MAGTALETLQAPPLITRAKADLAERTRATPYQSPPPADAQPPIEVWSRGV